MYFVLSNQDFIKSSFEDYKDNFKNKSKRRDEWYSASFKEGKKIGIILREDFIRSFLSLASDGDFSPRDKEKLACTIYVVEIKDKDGEVFYRDEFPIYDEEKGFLLSRDLPVYAMNLEEVISNGKDIDLVAVVVLKSAEKREAPSFVLKVTSNPIEGAEDFIGPKKEELNAIKECYYSGCDSTYPAHQFFCKKEDDICYGHVNKGYKCPVAGSLVSEGKKYVQTHCCQKVLSKEGIEIIKEEGNSECPFCKNRMEHSVYKMLKDGYEASQKDIKKRKVNK